MSAPQSNTSTSTSTQTQPQPQPQPQPQAPQQIAIPSAVDMDAKISELMFVKIIQSIEAQSQQGLRYTVLQTDMSEELMKKFRSLDYTVTKTKRLVIIEW